MPAILSVSSSRADVNVLRPVWHALSRQPSVKLEVLATGMHCSNERADLPLPSGVELHVGGADIAGHSGLAASCAMQACVKAAAELFERRIYDCIMLIGDRLDMVPAAFATLPFNIPLAHIHGGELTYGAIDERTRHALTKLSHLHFVSNVDAAERVARMGEEPWRIEVVGAPGLDTLADAPVLSAAAFSAKLNLPFSSGFVLVTVHPETNAADPILPMRAVLAALDRCGAPALITAPNADPGARQLQELIDGFLVDRPQVVFRASLGPELYPNALRHAVAMLGNSSSGLIEAAYFGLPVIDVGARQEGRLCGLNVCRVASDSTEIADMLGSILAKRPRHPGHGPYGDGRAGERIAVTLAKLPERHRLLHKQFHDAPEKAAFAAPWERSATQPSLAS